MEYSELLGERPLKDLPKIIGRYALLKEMNYGIGEEKLIQLSRGEARGNFLAALKRTISNNYRGLEGFSLADLEIAAVQLGVDELLKDDLEPFDYNDMDWHLGLDNG